MFYIAFLSTDLAEIKRYGEAQQGVVAQVRVVESQKEAQQSQNLLVQAQSEFQQAQLELKELERRYQLYINQALSDIKQAKLRLAEQQNSYQSVVQAGKVAVSKSTEQLKDVETQIGSVRSHTSAKQKPNPSLKDSVRPTSRAIARLVGTIFTLPITKPGSVVQPGQKIVEIAPRGTGLVLKAYRSKRERLLLKLLKKMVLQSHLKNYSSQEIAYE